MARNYFFAICLGLAAIGSMIGGAARPAAAALSCGGQSLVQPFRPWVDPANYVAVQNGSLEGTSGWTLAGGAKLVAGNEPWTVGSRADTHSLALPSGSSATSPALCVTLLHPTLRFFATNSGSPLSLLRVDAITTLGGSTLTLPVGLLVGGAWQPTLPVAFLTNLTSPLTGPVQFRFTPIGTASGWQIDDVYVDPFKDR